MQKQKTKPSTSPKRKGSSSGTTAKAGGIRRTAVKAPKAPTTQPGGESDRAVKERDSRKNEEQRVTNADEQKKAVNTSSGNELGDDEEFENRYEGEDEEDEDYSSLRTSVDDPSKESDDSEKVRKEIPRMS
jgi:hypothetical protein